MIAAVRAPCLTCNRGCAKPRQPTSSPNDDRYARPEGKGARVGAISKERKNAEKWETAHHRRPPHDAGSPTSARSTTQGAPRSNLLEKPVPGKDEPQEREATERDQQD